MAGDPTSFAQYASNVQKLASLKEQVSQVSHHITCMARAADNIPVGHLC